MKKKSRRRKPSGRRGVEVSGAPIRVRRPKTGEIIAVVIRMLGGNHLEVQCADERKRIARIPGKIRRRQWVRMGDVVLIEPWYGMDEDKKCDLVHRYRQNELRILHNRGYLDKVQDFLSR